LQKQEAASMEVPINIAAVLAAAMAKIFVESIWHGPLFGKVWMQLTGLSDKKATGMGKAHFFSLVGSFVMSYVLAYSLVFAASYLNMRGVRAGLTCGFWNWLGFIAPVTLGAVMWEGRSWKLWLLLNSNYLVSLLIMGVILAVWK
jgi:hypothetical protein